ncbi:MAG: GTP-binding protein [Alphaproteobacteria bacterium]|nr:GTP-binding protein [Alphaproteobacteria bacterium]
MAETAPLTVLTGFLGAGKTTLLNALVRRPEMKGTAVLVNEFGEIGLDHILMEKVEDTTILLPSGCLCCAIQGDLSRALRDLLPRVHTGEIHRVVVETTGLADPAPIVQQLMGDISVALRYRLDGIVTVVDAVHAMGQFDAHAEAVRQVAMADRIVLSKTDLAGDLAPLRARIRQLNPAAPVLIAERGAIDPAAILDCGLFDTSGKIGDVRKWLDEAAFAAVPTGIRDPNRHDAHIHSFCLSYDKPLHWQGVGTCLEMLIGTRGESLLRVKGILNLVGQDRPVAIHGVQHMFHEPVLLEKWPDGDPRTSRIVFITRDLDRATIEAGLAAFEAAAEGSASF